MNITIIDTKSANLNSVLQAIKRIDNVNVKISCDLTELEHSDKLILPGVGTASAIMDGIKDNDLYDFILNTKKDTLGICLGMQVLAIRSQEVPLNSDIDFIDTLNIVPCDVIFMQKDNLTLPHMGWNTVEHDNHPLFKDIKSNTFFYFVHSYCIKDNAYTIGRCTYGQTFSAAICRDNFIGVQFHPEKSGAQGLKLLENFIKL